MLLYSLRSYLFTSLSILIHTFYGILHSIFLTDDNMTYKALVTYMIGIYIGVFFDIFWSREVTQSSIHDITSTMSNSIDQGTGSSAKLNLRLDWFIVWLVSYCWWWVYGLCMYQRSSINIPFSLIDSISLHLFQSSQTYTHSLM